MYSNNILNFQESTPILDARTKKSVETYRMHLVQITAQVTTISDQQRMNKTKKSLA